jgi:hypothetical protein
MMVHHQSCRCGLITISTGWISINRPLAPCQQNFVHLYQWNSTWKGGTWLFIINKLQASLKSLLTLREFLLTLWCSYTKFSSFFELVPWGYHWNQINIWDLDSWFFFSQMGQCAIMCSVRLHSKARFQCYWPFFGFCRIRWKLFP